MLTHAETVSLKFVPHLFSKQGHVCLFVGKSVRYDYRKLRMTRPEFGHYVAGSYDIPLMFIAGGKRYWLFQFKFYKDSEGLLADEVKALLLTRQKLNRQRINRAKTIAFVEAPSKTPRTGIADDIKLLVWQRDQGKCAKCGAQTELQYDHIIPFSLGGASTAENLQILCGSCNRAKSASVV